MKTALSRKIPSSGTGRLSRKRLFFADTCFLMATAGICLFFALLFVRTDVFAEEAGTVRVGYYENEVFEEGAKEGAIKTGYAYEYYRKLSEYTGWKYEYVYGGYSELYQMLLEGKVDLLAGLAWKEERDGLIGYPEKAMGNESYTLVKHDSNEEITTDPATLEGKTIGVLKSAMVDVLNRFLEERHVTARVIEFEEHESMFAAFDSGELDILAAEGDGAYGRDHAEVLFPFGASDYYLCVNVKRPDLLAELNSAQSRLAAEEPYFLHSLSTKYYPVSMSSRAFSDAEREWLRTHETLRIGYLDNYLPYSDTDDAGQVTGLVKDLMEKMLSDLVITGISVNYTGYVNYDSMIEDTVSGKIDAAFPVGGGLYFSEENGIYQSAAIASSPTVLIYAGVYSEDTQKSFAVNENNRMQYYYVRTNFPEAEIILYPSIDDCLEAVLSGKADCTTLNGLRANDILRNSKYFDLSVRQLTKDDDRSFGVEIGNEGLLKILNRGISVIGTDYAQSIAYRYTGELYTYTVGDFIREHLALFIAMIIGVAALVIFFLLRDARRSKKEVLEKEEARLVLEEKNRELAEGREALAKALAEAEQANRAKTVFLNNMSHDIRTPMNAIIGFTDMASSHIDNQEEVKACLGRISVASAHLLSLINDVLDMSRIESGKLKLEEAPVHLPDVIRAVETIIRSNATEKGQEFRIEMKDVVHENVLTDQVRLNQVLINILSNAVKFTPDGGSILFRLTEKPGLSEDRADYEFVFRDNGIGMSEEFRETIFESFTREKTSTVSGIQGTGLGMAITKSIVDLMGGTISVYSKQNEGSEFVVGLSFRVVEERAEPHMPVSEEDSASQRDGNRAQASKKTAPGFAGKRVLLAEDNEMNQMIAQAILEDAGLQVEIAGNGQECVDKMHDAEAGYFDIILMDIQMPVMDGYEALKNIRSFEDPDKAGIPVVAVTANAFEEDRKNVLYAGMNGYLAKPYDVPKMLSTIRELLEPAQE